MTSTLETEKEPRLLSLPQALVIIGAVLALALTLDLSARARAGRSQSRHEQSLSALVQAERERNRQLQITLTYVHSDDSVVDYARSEGGMILPGEKRVVPMLHPPQPTPTPAPAPISAFAAPEAPWQAWWSLFLDSPPPFR